MFRIVKRKATGFFKSKDLPILKQAIQDVHNIITEASILLRAYYLDRYERVIQEPKYDEKPLAIDKDILSFACNIVQGVEKAPLRGENKAKNSKNILYNDLLNTFKQLYNGPRTFKTSLSLSHVLNYSIENLLTAYKNNVELNFPKYPKRYILCDLLLKGYPRDEAKRLAFQVTNHYLYDTPIPEEDGLSEYEELFPKHMTEGKPRCYDLVIYPWYYLAKMVGINRAFEFGFPDDEEIIPKKVKKLLNPLPIHTSFIPMHIRLDTSGLSQLLMNKEKIQDFKILYEIEHPGDTLNMTSKADMLSSFKKLFGREERTSSEAAHYASELWSFMTNLKTCRQYKEIYHSKKSDHTSWVFDNAIVTDGVSISFQVVESSTFQRKTFGKKKIKKQVNDGGDFKESEDNQVFLKAKKLAIDPGKRDILAVTDGFKTITYTKGQRNQDTYMIPRTKASLQKRQQSDLANFETVELSKCSRSSCDSERFKDYCRTRDKAREQSLKVYSEDPFFRQSKFTSYTTSRSSEMKFVQRVIDTFSPSQNPKILEKQGICASLEMIENATKNVDNRNDILIGWGNWGLSPNALKGSAPSPGIGIRRRFEGFFKTLTINEYLTSQTCPCCKEERGLKVSTINDFKRHHLLRCTNEDCQSRWWNRNVAGSFNILSRLLGTIITHSH
jgi:hypothetical protein